MSDDAESVPQHRVGQSKGPQPGEPYNYSRVLDTVLIPKVIYSDRTLSPGARILWGIIRRLGHTSGQCFATDARLADEMAVNERQVRRYCRQLVNAELMRETRQPGRVTVRELLWHSRFHGETAAPKTEPSSQAKVTRRLDDGNRPRGGTDQSGGVGRISPGGLDESVRTHPYRGISKGLLEAETPPPCDRPPSKSGGGEGQANNPAGGGGGGAPAGRPGAGRAKSTEATSARQLDYLTAPQDRETLETAADVSQLRVAKFIRYQYMVLMGVEPSIGELNSIVKLLRARRADHIAYACEMTAVLKVLKKPASVGIWIKKALEVGTNVSAAELQNAE